MGCKSDSLLNGQQKKETAPLAMSRAEHEARPQIDWGLRVEPHAALGLSQESLTNKDLVISQKLDIIL